MLKVIYGKNRRDLSRKLRGLVAEHQAENPLSRGFLLVPEQLKAGLERQFFLEDESRSLMLEEVLSFRRFALRLAEVGGGIAGRTLSSTMQAFYLGRLVEENKEQFESFSRALFRPSYLNLLTEAVGDLLRYQIKAEDLDFAAKQAELTGKTQLAAKLRDFARLLKAYRDKFSDLSMLPGDLLLQDLYEKLWALVQALDEVSGDWHKLPFPEHNYAFLKDCTIWVSGFGQSRELTPQEYGIVAALERLCKEVVITAEADCFCQSTEAADKGDPAFRAGRRLLAALASDFPDAEIEELGEPLPEPEYYIQRFDHPWDEKRWAAGEIKRLLATDKVKPSEIGIALADPQASQDMQLALRELDLPFYTSDSLLDGVGAFVRFNLDLLRLLRFGFERSVFLPLLRNPYMGLKLDEVDRFDHFLLSRGLEYEKIWDERRYTEVWRGLAEPEMAYSADESDSEYEDSLAEDLDSEMSEIEIWSDSEDEDDELSASEDESVEAMKAMRDMTLGRLRGFCEQMNQERTAADFAGLFLAFFEQEEFGKKVEEQRDFLLEKKNTDEAEAEVKAWNSAMKILSDLASLKDESLLSPEDFLYFYETALSQGIGGRIPANGNQIILGTCNQLALEEPDYLFILDAEQDKFPGKGFAAGLFHSSDRADIREILGRAFPDTGEQRIYANASHIYALLHLPEKRVYISYAGPGGEAETAEKLRKKLLFAPAVLDLIQNTSDYISHPAPFSLRDPLLADPERAYNYFRSGGEPEAGEALRMYRARAEHETDELCELKRYIQVTEAYKNLPDIYLESSKLCRDKSSLTIAPEKITALLGEESIWSVSRLERYASCPYAFMAQYLLNLKVREIYRPEASGRGTLLHKVMELAQANWTAGGLPPTAEDFCRQIKELQANCDDSYYQKLFEEALSSDPSLAVFREKGESYGVLLKAFKAAKMTDGQFFNEVSKSYGKNEKKKGKASDEQKSYVWLPSFAEWSFGFASRPFEIRGGDGQILRFRGRIDRIDLGMDPEDGLPEADIPVRLLDYKSNSKCVDYARLYLGLDLQLPIYMKAFASLNPEAYRVLEAGYIPLTSVLCKLDISRAPTVKEQNRQIENKLEKSELKLEPENLEVLNEITEERALELDSRVREGWMSASPRTASKKQSPCKYCNYRGLCRKDQGYIRVENLRQSDPLIKALFPKGEKLQTKDMKALLEAYLQAKEGQEHD